MPSGHMTRFPDSAGSIEAKVLGPRLAAWLESHWHERDVYPLHPSSVVVVSASYPRQMAC
jgi:hypothetical protein